MRVQLAEVGLIGEPPPTLLGFEGMESTVQKQLDARPAGRKSPHCFGGCQRYRDSGLTNHPAPVLGCGVLLVLLSSLVGFFCSVQAPPRQLPSEIKPCFASCAAMQLGKRLKDFH